MFDRFGTSQPSGSYAKHIELVVDLRLLLFIKTKLNGFDNKNSLVIKTVSMATNMDFSFLNSALIIIILM